MASSEATWTIDDAVEVFGGTGIPITRRQLVTLITILDIHPVGKRQGPRGRPALTYCIGELQRLQAAVAPWLLQPIEQEGPPYAVADE
jgi:hypothetical protein